MDPKFKLITKTFGEEKFKFNESLKYHTVLKTGGPAKLFFVAFTQQEIVKLVSLCQELDVAYFVVGTGSKVMISDVGFDGLVIKNRTRNIQTISVKGKVSRGGIGVDEAVIEADSGISIAKFVEYLEANNLASSEFINLPGSIGGNLFISKILQNRAKSIKVLDSNLEVEEIQPSELSLRKHIILSAIFKIKSKHMQ